MTLHPTGQWCKKVRGRFYYFGTDKQEALTKYLRIAADLHEGHPVDIRIAPADLTVKALANHYLAYQESRVDGGEISAKHFADCYDALELFLGVVGRPALVADLGMAPLLRFRSRLLKKYAPSTVNRHIGAVKAMFSYAADTQLVDHLPPIKKGLAKLPVKQLREHKAAKRRKNGETCFSPDDVRAMIAKAKVPLKAMVLLGVNGGFGNKDCADLRIRDIGFDRQIIDYSRVKTGVRRTVPLWPETVEALRESLAARPEPADAGNADLVFLTPRGHAWAWVREEREEGKPLRVKKHDEICKQFDSLLTSLGMKRRGVGFYALRHTHATLADRARDIHAQKRIMGHAIPGAMDHYIEDIEEDRLREVVNIVRAAVFPNSHQGK